MAKNDDAKTGTVHRRRHSIKVKTFFIMLLLTFGLGAAVLVMGFGLYFNGAIYQYYYSTWNMANAEAVLLEDVNVKGKCDEIIDLYDSFTPEERGDGKSPAYQAQYDPLMDDLFIKIKHCMLRLMQRNGPLDAFIVAIDEEHNRMIYLIDSDPDPATFVHPGTWSQYKPEDIQNLKYGHKLTTMGKMFGMTDHVQATLTNIQPYGWRCTAAATLYENGPYTILICVDQKLESPFNSAKIFLRQYVILLLIVTLLASLIGTLLMRKNLVTPINRMEKAARDYSGDHQKLESGVRYFDDLHIRTGDEIENLALTMKEMEEDLSTYVADLTRATAEKERINTELSLAAGIQASMLPKEFPAFPERSEFDICASMNPAKEVGGDFYDFFLIDDDHLALEIADVSGKGVPAALFMMASKILIATRTKEGFTPSQIFEMVNDQICSNNEQEMFVTVWLGILEVSTGKLLCASAGHEYPILIHADGRAELIHDKRGFVLGGMEGIKYQDYELQLQPGEKIFTYTDGVTEATRNVRELFGTDRLVETADGHGKGTGPEQLLRIIHKAIDAFVGEDEQFDDMTMLCLEYKGSTEEES